MAEQPRSASGGWVRSDVRMESKTVVITGANQGIGYETALDLAGRGARVIMTCRRTDAGEEARSKILRKHQDADVLVKELDLASLASVREVAREINDNENRLDVLINNAEIVACPKSTTVDGYDRQMSVNHIGHFLLTELLLDLLKKTGSSVESSRIIIVSSSTYKLGTMKEDDMMHDNSYLPLIMYFQTKLANVYHCLRLDARLQSSYVTANCVNPGLVRGRGYSCSVNCFFASCCLCLDRKVYVSPQEGAQTSIYCAIAPELDRVSGRYFSKCMEEEILNQNSHTQPAIRLWEKSERWVRENPPDTLTAGNRPSFASAGLANASLANTSFAIKPKCGKQSVGSTLTVDNNRQSPPSTPTEHLLTDCWANMLRIRQSGCMTAEEQPRSASGGWVRSDVRVEGKTVVITGGDQGIGFETVLDLAGRGARVIITCRRTDAGEEARSKILRKHSDADILVKELDLASLASVRKVAREINASERRLDVLINNTEIVGCPKSTTVDGYDRQMSVNHIGHFLLTDLLLDLLKRTGAREGVTSRIVIVTSSTHKLGRMREDDRMHVHNYSPCTMYLQTKLANVYHCLELAHRHRTYVTINCVNPGWVRGQNYPCSVNCVFASCCLCLDRKVYVSPQEGAQTSIYCAIAPELETVSGGYFSKCVEEKLNNRSANVQDAVKLMEWTEKLLRKSLLPTAQVAESAPPTAPTDSQENLPSSPPRSLWADCLTTFARRLQYTPLAAQKPQSASGGWVRSDVRVDRKTVVITGANQGIGYETALDLAGRGARVIMTCRKTDAGEEARSKMLEKHPDADILVKELDLASLASVFEFAREINDNERRLDVLINNAQIVGCPQSTTVDGYDRQMSVNHIGPFLLTELLLDLLKRTGLRGEGSSRIVIVTSSAHKLARMREEDWMHVHNYSPCTMYFQTKLANVYHCLTLADRLRGSNVTCNCLNPGLLRAKKHSCSVNCIFTSCCLCLERKVYASPQEGAQTSIYCAIAPELEAVSGRYFSKCAEEGLSNRNANYQPANRLEEQTMKWIRRGSEIPAARGGRSSGHRTSRI
ncbi:unnamed protein product [Clavelina lepadiformis]|uniref:Uncharacterized protein n=1 Tax=Clavelina lepadiformis TaxID=159417 RepID=A0ABP0FU02_CLALP